MLKNIPAEGEVWQHYKTKGEYTVLGVGQLQVKSTDLDMKECVIYKSLSDGKLWVRPVDDFIEPVDTAEGNTPQRFIKLR